MPSPSLLGDVGSALPDHDPEYFADIALARVVAAVCDRDLAVAPYFRLPARSVATVRYRQDVCRDLRRDAALSDRLRRFCETMAEVRAADARATRLRLPPERDAWALHGANLYLKGVAELGAALTDHSAASAGLRDLHGHLDELIGSRAFAALTHDAAEATALMERIEYTVWIKGPDVRIGGYNGEPDYGTEVAAVFDRFRIDAPARRTEDPPTRPGLDGVEAAVLNRVTELFPDTFRTLARFRERHTGYHDPVVMQADNEIRWYLAYLDFVSRLEAAGLPFTMPTVTDRPVLRAENTFDVAMAITLVQHGAAVVGNDLTLSEDERVLVVTGPNHGGKTSVARAFGQIHHLAALGLPVPGTSVEVGLFDALFTRFERPESVDDQLGRLEEDIVGMRAILSAATTMSVVVMNETFSSTSLEDEIRLGTTVVRRLLDVGARCVYVTFVDEIATCADGVVSMVADMPDDPSERTFRVRRRQPRGLAHADTLARRHGLDYTTLRRRIAS